MPPVTRSMKRARSASKDNSDEPQRKRRKVQDPQKPPKCRFNLMKLPRPILENIFTMLDVRTQQSIRCASKTLLYLHTEYILHLQSVFDHRSSRHNSEICGALKVFHIITDHYVASGYSELVAAMYLKLYKHLLATNLNAFGKSQALILVIRYFFSCQGSEHNLLRVISLINLLTGFRTYQIASSTDKQLHWNVNIQIANAYIFGVQNSETNRLTHQNKFINIVAILIQLLQKDQFGGYLCQSMENNGNRYFYGVEPNFKSTTPYLNLKFSFFTPRVIREVLEKCFARKWDKTLAVTELEKNIFWARFEVFSPYLSKRIPMANNSLIVEIRDDY